MEVVWSIESKFTYDKELEFIFEKWNNKEVVKFIQLVDEFVGKLEVGILKGKVLFHENLRSFVISKQTTVFFDYHEDSQLIELLLFWNNSQNPKKLKQLLSKLS